ncbi:chloride channel protein [Oscillospiraceae bacterium BX1]|uniref:Chloride channel protein n=2 Tax=Yanshouia hominis TaxID=2763673 RepID=A0ABR7NGK4_9FIRM|nr:chloride channel protein [Yanshouia hominis]
MRRAAYYSSNFVKWSLLATFVGLFVGGISTLFGHLLLFVNSYRYAHERVVWLLPLAGLAIVFLYRISDSANPRGTNLVIEAARSEEKLPARMAPLIFVSTILTHLCGGSAGREGAALQLGGSLGQLLGDKLRIEEENRNIMVMCGMSAGFSALFGTPIAAAIFPLGLASIGMIYYTALVPCTISSLVSYWVALYFGLSPERFHLAAFETTPILALRVVLLAVLCAVVSILMCAVLHQTGKLFQSIFPNQYLRIVVGGSLVCLAAALFGRDYLGAGMHIIERAIEGEATPAAFLLKLLFTAVTLGAGYKGGEIVPTLFVGATFGCTAGGLLGIPPSLAAALAMIAVFCGVTNCPLVSLLLAFELFDFACPELFLLAAAVSYMLSGYRSLYSAQKILHPKTEFRQLHRSTH